jgi:rhodanese-related sulfurtransferase
MYYLKYNVMKTIQIHFFKRLLVFCSIISIIVFTGCDSDDDDPAPMIEAQVLAEYLESADSPLGKDFVNTDLPAIITASDVNSMNLVGSVYIIDIRSAEDFATGHIANAVNVSAGQILNHVESTDLSGYEKVAIVCYTGQTAGWATTILRLMGHDNTFSMKFGMSSWNSDFAGKWNNNIGNAYTTQFTTDVTEKNTPGEYPSLNTGFTTGEEILAARVAAVLEEGFGAGATTHQTVFGNLDGHYIMNYWGANDYNTIGHIPGAIQYSPKESLHTTTDLLTLPTDKPCVVYCWTGQTSAAITAYLRIMGYDAKSLKFGVNGMIYDQLESHKWSEGAIMEYEYVTE